MDNKFIEAMEKRSDSELLEIVTKLRNDYYPEAVEAAELVIKPIHCWSLQRII